ncbi:hypothetical protein FE79_15040, partial [Staphylococcus aureus]
GIRTAPRSSASRPRVAAPPRPALRQSARREGRTPPPRPPPDVRKSRPRLPDTRYSRHRG